MFNINLKICQKFLSFYFKTNKFFCFVKNNIYLYFPYPQMSYPKNIESDLSLVEFEEFIDECSDLSDILYETDFYELDYKDTE